MGHESLLTELQERELAAADGSFLQLQLRGGPG
jgi:hypothetical protein